MMLKIRSPRMVSLWPALLAVSLVGCGSGGGEAGRSGLDFASIRAMGTLYSDYLAANKNRPPKDEQTFRKYLDTKEDVLQQAGLTVDQVFVSPRGGQPLQWLYANTPPMNLAGMTIIAYEHAPVDGKRLVVATNGMYDVMDESRFRSLFPNAR